MNHYLGTTITPWEVASVPELYLAALIEGQALQRELGEAGLLG